MGRGQRAKVSVCKQQIHAKEKYYRSCEIGDVQEHRRSGGAASCLCEDKKSGDNDVLQDSCYSCEAGPR